jgi:hypothetical protein
VSKTKFELETERVQKCAEELVQVCNKYEVVDVIEALGAMLGTYLMANGGLPALEFYLDYLLRKGKQVEHHEWWQKSK